MERYNVIFEEFYHRLITLDIGESWRMKCIDNFGGTCEFVFTRHAYEAVDGNIYSCIIYSLPIYLDAGIISQVGEGWEKLLFTIWDNITKVCGYKPYKEL